MQDAATVATNWVNGLSSRTDKIRAGIAAVTVAPGQLAARQADVWAQNTVAAKARFARNVGNVSLGAWQTAASTKGVDRIASGAAAAHDKQVAFYQKLLPFIAQAKASLPARGTYEQNKTRATAMMDKMHAFQK